MLRPQCPMPVMYTAEKLQILRRMLTTCGVGFYVIKLQAVL